MPFTMKSRVTSYSLRAVTSLRTAPLRFHSPYSAMPDLITRESRRPKIFAVVEPLAGSQWGRADHHRVAHPMVLGWSGGPSVIPSFGCSRDRCADGCHTARHAAGRRPFTFRETVVRIGQDGVGGRRLDGLPRPSNELATAPPWFTARDGACHQWCYCFGRSATGTMMWA